MGRTSDGSCRVWGMGRIGIHEVSSLHAFGLTKVVPECKEVEGEASSDDPFDYRCDFIMTAFYEKDVECDSCSNE